MRTILFLSYCFLSILFLCTPGLSSAGLISVDLAGNTLTVTAVNTPLQNILRELAAEGITVKIDPAINPSVSATFTARPMEQGLETLLKPASYSLLWEEATLDSGGTFIRLAEIQVFQSGRKKHMKPLPPARQTVITKNDEGVYHVRGEIILQLPSGMSRKELLDVIEAYGGILVEISGAGNLVKVLLPVNSDVFAISRVIKKILGLEIAQPNYAYPMQPPVYYKGGKSPAVLDAGAYDPADKRAAIAILDSGMAQNSNLERLVLSSRDITNPDKPLTDTLGHGTQMAFIASGLVKPYGAEYTTGSPLPIIPIRTFDDNGFTTDLNIMAAVDFALENNARVLSLSWGSETRSDFLEKTFAAASNRGLVIVASAGNEPTGRPVYPAAYPAVIGVGALEPHGKHWENSNHGDFVALYAPGFATLPVGHRGDPGLYAGTSISAAFTANVIAGYLSENPAATLQEIQAYIEKRF
ncbi:MAG: S8 family serine peptidase [Deltaproteobacteria bacterium]|jgi:hypothetical protein|nr:S8 family serine peptidase [Deltaproteobacteria bacterium]